MLSNSSNSCTSSSTFLCDETQLYSAAAVLCLQDEQQRPAVREVDAAAVGEDEEGASIKCARCFSLVHYGCAAAGLVTTSTEWNHC
jgi:hypothetical protein